MANTKVKIHAGQQPTEEQIKEIENGLPEYLGWIDENTSDFERNPKHS